jgi:MFS family permease
MMFIAGIFSLPGPIIGGYAHGILKTWRPLFIVSGLTTIAMAVARGILLKETLKSEERRVSPLKYSINRFRKEFFGDFKEILFGERSRSGFFLSASISSLAGGLLGFGMMGGGALLTKYAADVIRLDDFQIGIWGTASNATWFLSQILGGKIADRFGRKPVMIASGIVWVPQVILFLHCQNLLQVLAVEIPPLVVHSGSSSAYLALLSNLVAKERRATAMSMSTALSSIFGFPGPALGGLLYSTVSPQLPFYLNLLIGIPALLVLIFMVKEPSEKE